jgi:nicotinate-nucleotide pyrophosphorylase (carboxylating)
MLNHVMCQNLCRNALAEDVGSGDATTLAVVPENLEVSASIVAREECVCAGLQVAECVFKELDPKAVFEYVVQDGDRCSRGCILARVTGKAQAILTGERTALNFLQRLSGVATMSRIYVDALTPGSVTQLLDTRKTTPGWRALEKYAVKMGGATNHRFGLYDRVMIKDNHRELAKLLGPDSIQLAVQACRDKFPKLEVEVEADTLDEVKAALEAEADYILLDNMDNETVAKAIELAAGRSKLEASGGITLERIASLSALNVDFISVGALTHSAPAVDIALDIQPLAETEE